MSFNIAAVTFSLVLTIFLALYVTRSLIFLFVARNAVNSFTSNTSKRQTKARTSNSSSCNSVIAFLDKTDMNDRITHVKPVAKSETMRHTALDTQHEKTNYETFVSVLIASYNEEQVIDRLMKSCADLTYNHNNFEIIVIDDSEDETFHILQMWENKIQNLKVIHRNNRKGWKGGALNIALNNMSAKSSYALIVDADNILPKNILESFVSRFNECSLQEKNNNIVEVIQGYPIPAAYCNDNDNDKDKDNDNDNNVKLDIFDKARKEYSNWVSKAIDFRLAKRNLIEFVAKDKLDLPVQITGSLFMIRSEVIKLLGFSEDLTEDWDLTLDVYLSPDHIFPHIHSCKQGNRLQSSNMRMRKVLYDPALVSYSSTMTRFRAYFRQRMRVSEGHTRAFRKNIRNLLTSNIRMRDKIEFFFVGLQYSMFITVVSLIIIDLILLLSSGGIDFAMNDNFITTSLSVQAALLSVSIGIGFIALDVCTNIRSYNVRDMWYLLLLSSFTIPAFVIGSLYGFFRDEGIFYKTGRTIF